MVCAQSPSEAKPLRFISEPVGSSGPIANRHRETPLENVRKCLKMSGVKKPGFKDLWAAERLEKGARRADEPDPS